MSFQLRVIKFLTARRTASSVALAAAAFVRCRLMSAQSRRLLVRTYLGAMLVVLLSLLAYAQAQTITRTWDGGGTDNNWSTAGNWSSNLAPGGTDQAALFTNDPVGQTKLSPNLSANVTIGQLQYSATAPSYTITGSGTSILNISPAASYGGVGLTVASGAANQTITPEVFFLSTQSWDIGGTTTVTATGTIEDDSVIDYGLAKNGTGALVFPGDVRYDGPTTVNAGTLVLSFSNTSMLSAFTVNGGILRATTSANAMGNNATRNTIALAGGALELSNNTGLTFGSTSRVTTVSGNATIRSDRLTAGAGVTHTLGLLRIGAQTLSATPGANDTSGTAGITFGATTLSGNATFNVANSGSAGAQLTLGAIGQSGGAQSLTKFGNGALRLNGAGNYTGSTTLSQGTITLGVANALGSGGFTFAGGTLNANNTADSTIGALALTADSTLNLSAGGAAATLTFAGSSGTANGILTITGWSGVAGGLGTNDKIVFSGGVAPNADFLQHIRFDLGGGNTYFGVLGAGGELIPSATSGPPTVAVPNVTLLTQSVATNTIVAAGLTVGTVTTAPSSTVPAGSVVSQSPLSGTLVSPSTPIGLVISSGPAGLIAGTTGAIEAATLPPNLNGGQFISQTQIRLIHEGTGIATAGMPAFQADAAHHNPALGVGQPADATFANAIVTPYGGPGLPAVGTAVYSLLLHFDPNVSGLPFDLTQGVAQSATITFDRPVIGVYVTSDALDVTDAIFGSGTIYPTGNIGRDMEFNYDGDNFSISPNRLTLSLTMFSHNGGVLDEMRVILPIQSTPVIVPNVAGQTQLTATSALRTAGLVVTSSTQPSTTVPMGSVISQVPSAGTQVSGGTTVMLVISAGASNAPPVVVLTAPADLATGVGASVTLTASVTDTDATTVTFYGRKTAPTISGPDFVIGTLPDTQFYSQDTGGNLAAIFSNQTQWYADSRTALNLAFISHLGDMVQSGDNGSDSSEWNVADNAMRIIEDPRGTGLPYGIPWGGAPGNHDQTTVGQLNAPNTKWNQFFGADRWAGRPYFGGSFSPTNNSNNYELFKASGLEFLIIHLQYTTADGVDQAVIDWADGRMKAYPQRRVIVTSHWILDAPPASPIGAPAPFGGPGQRFFDKFKDNPNFFLMLSGHVSGEGRRMDVVEGRTIYSVFQDYQDRANGGNGWLRYFVFSPANNTITAKTYSPTLDQFESDTDATSSTPNQASEFVLPYGMQSAVAPWTTLGTANVAAGGGSAQLNWTGLDEGSTYEWYVAASDGSATTTSTARTLLTSSAVVPTVAFTSPINNEIFTAPVNVTLAATTDDTDGFVTKVEFFDGSTKLAAVPKAPYSYTWPNAPVGAHVLTATATDYSGGTTSTSVAITVSAPLMTPACTLTANPSSIMVGNSSSLSWTTTNAEALSIDQGIDAATPVAAGSRSVSPTTTTVYTATVTGPGGANTCGATLTVNQAPAITSANNATFTAGSAASFSVTATGVPTPTLSVTGTLPAGVTFNAATGVLGGTPGAGTGGNYAITFTAQNGVSPNATQSFALTVNQPPAITSANSTAFAVGTAGTFTVTATGFPIPTLSQTGALPPGVTFNAATRMLSGTPAAGTAGSYPITFTAQNGVGANATQSFTLTVNAVVIPGVAFVKSAGNSGQSVQYTVNIAPAAGNFLGVFVWQVEGAATPSAMTDNLGSVYTKDCDVTYNQGFGARRLTVYHLLNAPTGITGIRVTPNRPSRAIVAEYSGMPTSGAVLDVCGTVNTQTTASTSWSSNATVTTASDLVFGLVDTGFTGNAGYSASGAWSGRAAQHDTVDGDDSYFEDRINVAAGSYTATGATTASVAKSSVVVAFKASLGPVAPTITSASSTTFSVGTAGTFTVTATGVPTPTLSQTGALPTGVTFNAATGVLGGTPAAGTAGSYPITFTAQNALAPNATQSFTLTVNPQPVAPTITSANNAAFTVGIAGTFTVTATGTPTPTLSVTGTLPTGMTFNAATGVLGGTPGAGTGGNYAITFTAQNGASPNATQSFALTVNQPSAITSVNSATFGVGAAGTFTVTATGFPAPTVSQTGALPSGVTFNAATRILSGTPAAGTAGSYPITFTATNGVGANATQNFTLTVNAVVVPGVAFVKSAGNSGQSVQYTVNIAPAAGNFLAVFVWQVEGAATPSAITDNRGSVYTKDCDVTYNQGFGARRLTVYHLLNAPSGIASVTITPNRPSRAIVAEYSGMPISGAVLDVCGTVNTQATASTSWSSSATVTTASDLVFGLVDTGFTGNAGYSASGAWTGRVAQHDTVDGDDSYFEDRINVAAGSYTATGNTTVSVQKSSIVVAFRTGR